MKLLKNFSTDTFAQAWITSALFVLYIIFFRKIIIHMINIVINKNENNIDTNYTKTNTLFFLLSEIKNVPLPKYTDEYKIIGVRKPIKEKVVNQRDGRWLYLCAQSTFQELVLAGLVGYAVAIGTMTVPITLKYIERVNVVLSAVIHGYPIPRPGEDPKKVIRDSGWEPQFNPGIMDIHS